MEKQIEIHAYHGWGFTPEFWKPLQRFIPDKIIFKAADRGYFGRPSVPRFESSSAKKVVFVHSFGFHWSNTAVLSKADVLVLFNSFVEFIPAGDRAARRKLELTIQTFENHPEQVLEQFIENAFYPHENSISDLHALNTGLMHSDLKQLRSTRYPMIDLDSLPLIVTIDSGKDRVLGAPRGNDLLQGYVGKKAQTIFEDDGHALPFVKAQECWSYLSSVVPIFASHENNRSAGK